MMKTLTALITLSLFFICSSSTFSQWTSQYQNLSGQVYFYSIAMADENNGYVVGANSNDAGIIYKTTDGGEDFDIVLGSGSKLISVWPINSNIAIATGYNGRILKTTDIGDSWITISSGTSRPLFSVYFVDTNVGWIAGGHYTFGNVILKTTDQGESWVIKPAPVSTGILRDIYFVDNDTGWSVGYDQNGSIILKTTNGGDAWVSLDSGVDDCRLYTVFFQDENIGWVAGERDPNGSNKVVLLKTTNGGASWVSQITSQAGNLLSLRMRDANNGWAVGVGLNGANGLLYETMDGGNTWIKRTELGEVSMNCLFFLNSSIGWGNSLSTVYKYQAPAGNDEYYDNQDKINIYPNPFTTSTTLLYELQQPEKVILSIYNHLGQIVYQTKENRSQGKQQHLWNAVNYPNGIYYYRLKVGDVVANGKMVKVR